MFITARAATFSGRKSGWRRVRWSEVGSRPGQSQRRCGGDRWEDQLRTRGGQVSEGQVRVRAAGASCTCRAQRRASAQLPHRGSERPGSDVAGRKQQAVVSFSFPSDSPSRTYLQRMGACAYIRACFSLHRVLIQSFVPAEKVSPRPTEGASVWGLSAWVPLLVAPPLPRCVTINATFLCLHSACGRLG